MRPRLKLYTAASAAVATGALLLASVPGASADGPLATLRDFQGSADGFTIAFPEGLAKFEDRPGSSHELNVLQVPAAAQITVEGEPVPDGTTAECTPLIKTTPGPSVEISQTTNGVGEATSESVVEWLGVSPKLDCVLSVPEGASAAVVTVLVANTSRNGPEFEVAEATIAGSTTNADGSTARAAFPTFAFPLTDGTVRYLVPEGTAGPCEGVARRLDGRPVPDGPLSKITVASQGSCKFALAGGGLAASNPTDPGNPAAGLWSFDYRNGPTFSAPLILSANAFQPIPADGIQPQGSFTTEPASDGSTTTILNPNAPNSGCVITEGGATNPAGANGNYEVQIEAAYGNEEKNQQCLPPQWSFDYKQPGSTTTLEGSDAGLGVVFEDVPNCAFGPTLTSESPFCFLSYTNDENGVEASGKVKAGDPFLRG